MTVSQNNSCMNRAGAICGCGALCYLAARSILTFLAGVFLSSRVPGASLANPAGFSPAQAAALRLAVSALSLAAPFSLLLFHPVKKRSRAGDVKWSLTPRLFLFFWSSMLIGNGLSALIKHLEPGQSSRVELPYFSFSLFIAYFAICLLPAVGEELLFRGLFQNWLLPFGPAAAILGQAVLFSLLHGKLSACVAAFFGGIALGVCAYRTHSLLPGILFHLYNNSLAFASQYGTQFWDPALEQILSFSFLLLPVLFLFYPALRQKTKSGFLIRNGNTSILRIFYCPGWSIAAVFLFFHCLVQTFF